MFLSWHLTVIRTQLGDFNSVLHLVLHNIPELNKQLMLDPTPIRSIKSAAHTLTKEDTNSSDFLCKRGTLVGQLLSLISNVYRL